MNLNSGSGLKLGQCPQLQAQNCKFRIYSTFNTAIIIRMSFMKEMYFASTKRKINEECNCGS